MDTVKTYTVDEARKKLEHYCAYQERCHKEVVQKLRDMRMIPEAIDLITVKLIQDNFLNEERFANAFAQGKFRIKKWGKYRIRQELKRRDIGKTLIDLAVRRISDEDYYETFQALAEQRASQIKESNVQKKRKKLADYLLYRGWESPMVYEAVHKLVN